jgi:sugar/nucleoside kinase (ribokinase family)
MRQEIDYLIVGHITRDVRPGKGDLLGGTVTYSSITAARMGYRVGVVTSAGDDFPWRSTLEREIHALHVIPSDATTTYFIRYLDGSRELVLEAQAKPIAAGDVPAGWLSAPLVHLAPVSQEVDPEMAKLLGGKVLVTPQGWMRCWDGDGRVVPYPFVLAPRVLPHASVMVVSEEDIDYDRSQLAPWLEQVQVLGLTQGRNGCTVFAGGEERRIPPRKAEEVDPTGAGDIFAAAFLIRWWETEDPWLSGYFANVVASFSVERWGVAGIPPRHRVEAWMEEHPLWGS